MEQRKFSYSFRSYWFISLFSHGRRQISLELMVLFLWMLVIVVLGIEVLQEYGIF